MDLGARHQVSVAVLTETPKEGALLYNTQMHFSHFINILQTLMYIIYLSTIGCVFYAYNIILQLGGADPFADFCPYSIGVTYCQNPASASQPGTAEFGESFGPNSFWYCRSTTQVSLTVSPQL
jgi:hypothetical protein